MNFGGMYGRLMEDLKRRVANGEISERGLARITGISQPHIHNVLKGIRVLSPESADRVLTQLRINTRELWEESSGNSGTPVMLIPLLTGNLGPGMLEFRPDCTKGTVIIPSYLAGIPAQLLVAARLGEDLEATPRFQSGDLVLIDQSLLARTQISRDGAYVIRTDGGPRVRYARVSDSHLYVASEHSIDCPSKWQAVSLEGQTLLDLVQGRVVWVSRQLGG